MKKIKYLFYYLTGYKKSIFDGMDAMIKNPIYNNVELTFNKSKYLEKYMNFGEYNTIYTLKFNKYNEKHDTEYKKATIVLINFNGFTKNLDG